MELETVYILIIKRSRKDSKNEFEMIRFATDQLVLEGAVVGLLLLVSVVFRYEITLVCHSENNKSKLSDLCSRIL